ncbi:MAG TPA: hypothetical protein VIT67_03485 [Povalibacter sp.]
MVSTRACELPGGTLLRGYSEQGAYVDCYVTDCARPVSHAEYVEAFYTTAVFKLERLLLSLFVDRPSTDAGVRDLAEARTTSFAAWTVEARSSDQLLLTDFMGHTRSWLMVTPASDGRSTQLWFGSAVVPVTDRQGRRKMGWRFRALLGFHKLYSRVLLSAAARRIASRG